MKKIVIIILMLSVLMSSLQISSSALNIEDGLVANERIQESYEAYQLYSDRTIISCQDFVSKKMSLEDGVTVIYGKNIDVYAGKLFNQTQFKSCEKNILHDAVNNPNAFNCSTECITYMLICMKQDNIIDAEYVSVTYEKDVDINVINAFIECETEAYAIDARVMNFICDYVSGGLFANNLDNSNNARASSLTTTVQTLRDTNYYIANYTTNTGSVYPLMIYKKEITYVAQLQANELPEDDLYIIMAYVTVIPGNDISSLEAAEYASINRSEIYNSTYGNAIALKSIRTIFENLFPDMDYYINMSPRGSLTDVAGRTLSISLGLPPSISVEVLLDFVSDSQIDMTTEFDPYGKCVVQFDSSHSILSENLSTEMFNYTAGVYMYSGSTTLSTRVATDIMYYFQPYQSHSAVWSGSAREFYYENN